VSLRTDGRYRCDRCDRLLVNGGVHEAAIISDLDPHDPEGGTLRVLHLCRDSETRSGSVIEGCVNVILTPDALPAWDRGEGAGA
jgi:hypothetical protein